MHIGRGKQVHDFSVFQFGRNAHMGMLAAAGHAGNGFCLEGNVQAVLPENFLDDNAGQNFIVRRLQAHVVFPVHFQLFIDMGHMAGRINLSFNTAAFLMSHLRLQPVQLQHFNGLFQRRAHIAPGPLPVHFLHDLGGGQCFNGRIFPGGFYPEFQFGGRRENQMGNFIDINIFQPRHMRILFQQRQQLVFHIPQGFLQKGTGVHVLTVMCQEARHAQSANHAPLFIKVFVVIIHVPVYIFIYFHVHTGIVQGGDTGQHHGRTVGLGRAAGQEFVDVMQKDIDRNLFIRIISCQVHAHQRNKLHFFMIG